MTKKECYYHRLSENLGKAFIIDKQPYKQCLQYETNLIECLTVFSKSKLCELETLINIDLEKYSNAIYISEKLHFMKDILNFKLYKVSPKKERMALYLYLMNFLENNDKKLLYFFLYEIRYRLKDFSIDSETITKKCMEYINDPLFYRMKLAHFSQQNNLDAYQALKNEELFHYDSLNSYQKYSLHEFMAFIEFNAQSYDRSYSSVKKCIEILKQSHEFDDSHLNTCYKHMGKISFFSGKYDEVIQWFSLVLDKSESIELNYVLLFHALEKTNQKDEIIKTLDSIHLSNTKTITEKKFLLYYKLKYKNSNLSKLQITELEDFICDEIKPLLVNLGTLYRTIFLEELKEYVRITSNYKKLYLFGL